MPRHAVGLLVTALVIGAAGSALVFRAMERAGKPDDPSLGKPVRQVRLELAFTKSKADTLLARWGDRSAERLRHVILLDYALIPAYVLLFGSFCLLASRRMTPGVDPAFGAGALLAATVLAGLLDAAENAAMLAYLQTTSRSWAPPVAGILAVGKFGLLAVVLIASTIRLVRPR